MQFDDQADIYDNRTGLGDHNAQKITESVDLLIQNYQKGMFLEIGAGTGEIGFFLQKLPISYVGLDSSKGMLDVYRQRYQDVENTPELVLADGNTAWPFPNNSVSVFFSSRAMHQLDHHHVIKQLENLSISGSSLLILGNVKRNKDSSKAIMRKEMHKILNDYGIKEKSGQSNRRFLFDAIKELGGVQLPSVTASRWRISHAPIESINSWKNVDGIAGQMIDKNLKNQVLETLTERAQEIFTDINTPLETEESYELNAIKLSFHH